MPANTVTITPGQTVTLTAQATFQGNVGGNLPGPVTWTHNSMGIGVNATLTATGTVATLAIPPGTTIIGNNAQGSFSVSATSGMLNNSIIIWVQMPADGLQIVAGVPM